MVKCSELNMAGCSAAIEFGRHEAFRMKARSVRPSHGFMEVETLIAVRTAPSDSLTTRFTSNRIICPDGRVPEDFTLFSRSRMAS